MSKAKNKSQTMLKHFMFSLKFSFYCDLKRIRTETKNSSLKTSSDQNLQMVVDLVSLVAI